MMNTNRLAAAAELSDEDLLARLEGLASQARASTADLIAHLAELARRKAHRGECEGSLFKHCTQVLRLSEAAACNRIAAAYAARKFPVILDFLADGSVNLTTIRVVAPHLTEDNHVEVLESAMGKTKEEVKEICVRLAPRPDVPSSVRRLSAQKAASDVSQPATVAPTLRDGAPSLPPSLAQPTRPSATAPAPRPLVEPLSPERYRVQFTVGKDTREKLRRVQDLMRRQVPDGDPGVIFDRALDLLLAQAEKRAFSSTTRPRFPRVMEPRSRTIPAAVERAVWAREAGQCAFVGRTGRRCSEKTFLEFHHVDPHAHEGEPTVENIALRCRAHNVYESELVFGRFDASADREWLPGGAATNLSWNRSTA
jgi:5-methylcytosine-specific restriction endonuclease McrA